MCRSIKRLRHPDGAPTTHLEIEEAARQFVRKVSGYRTPAARNEAAFEAAVQDVGDATRRLLETLEAIRQSAQPQGKT